jgi:hypothetical protein
MHDVMWAVWLTQAGVKETGHENDRVVWPPRKTVVACGFTVQNRKFEPRSSKQKRQRFVNGEVNSNFKRAKATVI